MYLQLNCFFFPRFKEEMEKLKLHSTSAWEWVTNLDPKQWSRAHFTDDPVCDILLNNLCESFNSAIVSARDKPIITLVEMVRCYIMRRIESKQVAAEKMNQHVPHRILKLVEKNRRESRACIVEYAGNLAFQVKGFYGDQYVVDLRAKSCACNRWKISGIPCCHAIACIDNRGLNVFAYVSDYLSKVCYEKVYSHTIRPINGPELWKRTDLPPVGVPTFKKQRGRPKKMRRKEPEEYTASGTSTVKLKRTYIRMRLTLFVLLVLLILLILH